mmetsp:Transcript_8322/g.17788  ORF Transcript_8322/g.17788 Transcript_8322/m.17788 type:complete len:477 (+) Transcript_8322:707-2137(+)
MAGPCRGSCCGCSSQLRPSRGWTSSMRCVSCVTGKRSRHHPLARPLLGRRPHRLISVPNRTARSVMARSSSMSRTATQTVSSSMPRTAVRKLSSQLSSNPRSAWLSRSRRSRQVHSRAPSSSTRRRSRPLRTQLGGSLSSLQHHSHSPTRSARGSSAALGMRQGPVPVVMQSLARCGSRLHRRPCGSVTVIAAAMTTRRRAVQRTRTLVRSLNLRRALSQTCVHPRSVTQGLLQHLLHLSHHLPRAHVIGAALSSQIQIVVAAVRHHHAARLGLWVLLSHLSPQTQQLWMGLAPQSPSTLCCAPHGAAPQLPAAAVSTVMGRRQRCQGLAEGTRLPQQVLQQHLLQQQHRRCQQLGRLRAPPMRTCLMRRLQRPCSSWAWPLQGLYMHSVSTPTTRRPRPSMRCQCRSSTIMVSATLSGPWRSLCFLTCQRSSVPRRTGSWPGRHALSTSSATSGCPRGAQLACTRMTSLCAPVRL